VETVTLLQSAFDALLGFALLWLAWRALSSPALFRAIVLFIAFGLLMALAWVRLDATDGALLLAALARLESKNEAAAPTKKTMNPKFMTEGGRKQTPFLLLLMVLMSALIVGLGYAVLSLPSQAPGLGEWVTEPA